MLRNFFVVALRNFFKQRTQSILNVSGLAIGLTCAIYVYLYAYDELTFDRQHPEAENTYRILTSFKNDEGKDEINAWALEGWAHYMKQNLKGVKSYSSLGRFGWPHSFYFTQANGEQRIVLSEDVTYAMKNYADFFYLELLQGDKKTLFEQPTDMLISETAARELFGSGSPLNKSVEVSNPSFYTKMTVVVKGIFRDMPYNMQYGRSTKYIINRALRKPLFEHWQPSGSFENMLTAMWYPAYGGAIYFQTEPGADLNFIENKLTIEINKIVATKVKDPGPIDFQFLKITDTHFSGINNIILPEMIGQRQYLYIFLTIGAFILLISCINYTNLATAHSMQRAKEVGMRKAMGSYKKQLVFQFLHESFLVTGVSIFLALILAVALLPFFSDFANKDFVVADIFTLPSVSVILLLWITVSVLSGLYPAFYMASLQPIKILKGSGTGKGGNVMRQALMLFQVSISIVLLVFTLVVIRQMNEMINNDLNNKGDQILSIRYGNFAPFDKLNVFRNELARHPDLSVSSFGNHLPQREDFADLSSSASAPAVSDQIYTWEMMSVGADFPKVFDLELIAGKLFDNILPDTAEILINEQVALQLNVDAHALIGEKIIVTAGYEKTEYNFRVRGVVKDFKYKSAHNKIPPLILTLEPRPLMDIIYYIKLPVSNIQQNIAAVQEVWKKVMPQDVGMSYWFISDEFNRLYFEENALNNLSRAFTVFGILTTCIGLFGMSAFLAERRSKEMAIRKVMGAGSSDVLRKMVMPFLRLMAIASLVGIPIAYYFSTQWLANFVYKVQWSWISALLAVSLVLFMTLFTISFQTLKSANANPIDSLKE